MNAKNHRRMAKMHQKIADLTKRNDDLERATRSTYQLETLLGEAQSRNQTLQQQIARHHELSENSSQAHGRVLQLLDGLSDSQYIPVGTVRAAVEGTDLDTVEVNSSVGNKALYGTAVEKES